MEETSVHRRPRALLLTVTVNETTYSGVSDDMEQSVFVDVRLSIGDRKDCVGPDIDLRHRWIPTHPTPHPHSIHHPRSAHNNATQRCKDTEGGTEIVRKSEANLQVFVGVDRNQVHSSN